MEVCVFLQILLLTFYNIHSVSALARSQWCFYGCNSALYRTRFTGVFNICDNPLFYESNYYCAAVYCSQGEILSGLHEVNKSCNYVLPPFEDVLRDVDLDVVPRIGFHEAPASFKKPLDHAVIPDQNFWNVGYRSIAAFYTNLDLSYDFSYSLYGFWGLVVIIGLINGFFEARRSHLLHRQGGLWLWVRKSLILPAMFGEHCQEPIGWCTLPPRLESILLVFYIVLNIVYCLPGYNTFSPNTIYPEVRLQLCRFISDRTGILSIANVPIFWLFSTRNDPLLWLSGWSFATYNRFHRWVARVSTAQAVAHGVGYTVLVFYQGGFEAFATQWKFQYWWTGEVATIVMSLALLLAVYPLRRDYYDLFLALHIVLGIIFLVTLYYHVAIFNGRYNVFIWPCVAMWALDRLLRLIRIAYCSIRPMFLSGVRATATYDPKSELIRLDVTDFLSTTKIQPGIFYYLYDPVSLRGYENHPMTLCSWRSSTDHSPHSPSDLSSIDVKDDDSIEQTHSGTPLMQSGKIRHTFLIRPYEGWTSRLQTRLAASLEVKSSSQHTIFLEGPYGNHLDLSSYSNILVIAGGSGITSAISHTHHLLQTDNTIILIVWAVPQIHFVDDICKHELAFAISHPRVTMEVYLTGAAADELDDVTPNPVYKVHFGRPDVLAKMEQVRWNCERDLAIVSCGTPPMSDACRKAVVDLLKQDGPAVGYFDEAMTW